MYVYKIICFVGPETLMGTKFPHYIGGYSEVVGRDLLHE